MVEVFPNFLMLKLKIVLPSLITFFLGTGSLFIADILISRFATTATIASWATIRSFMMIGSVCAIFGMGQLIVREPKAAKIILKYFILNCIFIAIIGGIVGAYFGYVGSVWIGVIAISGVSITNMSFHWLRSNLAFTRSYIANSSWRVLFLLLVGLFLFRGYEDIGTLLAVSFCLSALVIAYLLASVPKLKETNARHNDIKRPKDIYIVGATYFMSGLSLAIASYGENLIVYQLGTNDDVAIYFRSVITFLFPGVILNQYLAALAGPLLRQDEGRVIGFMLRKKYLLVILTGLLCPTLIIGGLILEFMIYGENTVPWILILMLTLTSCVRICYIIPSSFVGVLASKKELQNTTLLYLLCAALFPVFAIIFNHIGLSVIVSVAAANLLNWVFRNCVGLSLVFRRINLYKEKLL